VPARRLRDWQRTAPRVTTPDRDLAAVLHRSVEDIGRIFDPAHPDRPVVAAGAPWFMAPFGRDSLLTSWMLVPWDDSLAAGTLQTLADRQGHAVDPATEERADPARGPVRPGRRPDPRRAEHLLRHRRPYSPARHAGRRAAAVGPPLGWIGGLVIEMLSQIEVASEKVTRSGLRTHPVTGQ